MFEYELIKLKENTLNILSSLIATHLNVDCKIGGSPQSEGGSHPWLTAVLWIDLHLMHKLDSNKRFL